MNTRTPATAGRLYREVTFDSSTVACAEALQIAMYYRIEQELEESIEKVYQRVKVEALAEWTA